MEFYKHMKNKPVLISVIVIVLLTIGFYVTKSKATDSSKPVTASPPVTNTANTSAPMSVVPADKVEVANFFGTQRCVSCLTIGRLSKKTIEEKFADEVKSGKIVFREINGELPENEAMVQKYQARGSSLFINAIRGNEEDISEDTTVWRLVNDEEEFVTYLEEKLNTLLGK